MQTDVLDHGFVRFVDSMPALASGARPKVWGPGDQRVVDAARVSIAGAEVRPVNDDQKLLRYLLKNKHTSPFEKVRFEFHCKMPIFIARQWIRHRMGSFNEQSARYGVMREEFYIPTLSRMQAQSKDNKQASGETLDTVAGIEAQNIILSNSRMAYERYEHLLKLGLARELARIALPLNMYTQWYWTVDLHNLMHFLQLRLHEHAQYEIRVYADAILEMASYIAPWSIAVFKETLEA